LERPFVQPTKKHQQKEEIQIRHLEFSGKSHNCCVCVVDIIGSTKLVSKIPVSKISIFYSTFLNSMANIVEKNNGKIVKSMGDALLFYFEDSLENYIGATLRCGLEIVDARDKINNILNENSLPSISYRVSSDYGLVLVGSSSISAVDDIFGSVVNMCSKINPLGNPNGMVIGNDFHLIAKSLLHGFQFHEIKINPVTGLTNNYQIFDVKENNR
jgi:class 3 adenylate cyclase